MAAPDPVPGRVACRFCRSERGEIVLDVGSQPAADRFPRLGEPGPDPLYPLRMWLCAGCGLAQLVEDPTVPEEPRGQEPLALIDQARDAVSRIMVTRLLSPGQDVAEYGSPHGGSWLTMLTSRGLRAVEPTESADGVIDNIGMMHDRDQAAGLASRVARLRPGGILMIQFHSLASILRGRQWNALRHGHYAYYSTPALIGMLETFGLSPRTALWFPLYNGTVLLAASREGEPDDAVRSLVADEIASGVLDAQVVRGLQQDADASARSLRQFLTEQRAAGRVVYGYSAASRAVALLHRAGVGPNLLPAVADAAAAKHGRRIPGCGIPIIRPEELRLAHPDVVLLFVEDLLAEVRAAFPEIETAGGRWVVAGDNLPVRFQRGT